MLTTKEWIKRRIKELWIDYKNVATNIKMVSYMQTNFKQVLGYKLLLCSHLE